MPIESPPPIIAGDISDLSSISSAAISQPSSPRSGTNTPVNDPRSSITPAGGPPEAKPFLTWVYEGFCHILSLIWNLFFPPQEPLPRSRESSEDSLVDTPTSDDNGTTDRVLMNFRFTEQQFKLKDHETTSDHRSDKSGSNPDSTNSAVLVSLPSDAGSAHSHGSSDFRSSDPVSLGSNPLTIDSNPRSTGSEDRVIENALYLLAQSKNPEYAPIHSCKQPIPDSLRITVHNQTDIREVLKTIGENTAWGLGLSSFTGSMIPRLKELGANIDREVHPYRFLIEIFTNADSKASLITLYNGRNDLFTGKNLMWAKFAADLGKSFENRSDDITSHTDFFAEALKVRHSKVGAFVATINNLVQAKNWNGLLEYLITHVKTHSISAR